MIPAYWKRNYYAKRLKCNIDVYDAVVLQICISCIFLVEMLFCFVDFLLLLICLGRCKYFSYFCSKVMLQLVAIEPSQVNQYAF